VQRRQAARWDHFDLYVVIPAVALFLAKLLKPENFRRGIALQKYWPCSMETSRPTLLPPSVRPRKPRLKERYELQEEVGAGGMGTVYRALDRALNRTVAVKVLRPALVPGLRNLLRLKRELVLASRVSDEHVVRVHDIGEVGGKALIAMDWVDGESLAQLLGRVRTLPPSQVHSFAGQICRALSAIHAANIIHRDLKPGNLLIRKDGAILVSDFGLARSILPQDFNLSRPSESSGTPRYMAPEQLAGLPADARSDLYSLGMVLLEMLTGTTALETIAALRLRLLSSTGDKYVRSAELRHLAALEVAIRHCLHLDRAERCPSADAVLDDLKPASFEAATLTSNKPSWRKWALLGSRRVRIGLCAAILVLALPVYLASRHHVAFRAAETEQLYARAMNLLGDRSGEPELRAALDTLDRVVANDPNHVNAVRARLETLIRLFDQTHEPQWLEKLRDALKSNTVARLSDEERILFRAKVDFNAGLLPDVVQALQAHPALLASSKDASLLLGRALAGSGELERALTYYLDAIRLSPESWRAHNDLGSALLRLGRLKESAQQFVRVTELKPDAPTGYSNLGSALLDVGDLAGARRNFEIALQRAASPPAYYSLGVTAYYSRDYATSIPFFESAIQMRPNSDVYVAALADTLRHLHRTERARDTYARALTLVEQLARTRPLSVEEQCRRAIYLARLGDHSAATSALDAIAPDSKNQDFDYARGVVALLEGRIAAANRHLKDAVGAGYPSMLIEMDPDLR
jgi:serine/threonine-protein kinase